MSARIKILAGFYFFILAVIVTLANFNETQYLFEPIRQLPFGDKIGHFVLMGFFSLLVNLVLNVRAFHIWRFRYLLGSLIVLTVVTLEELSQIFIRSRSFDFGDLLSDYAGIFLFGELARLICRRKERNIKSEGLAKTEN